MRWIRAIGVLVSLALGGVGTAAETVTSLADAASTVNPGRTIAETQFEVAEVQYEVDIATATEADTVFSVESARLTATQSYRKSIRVYFYEVIDAVFDVGTASIDLEIAELRLSIAETDRAFVRTQHTAGVLSDTDLNVTELEYRDQENSHAQAVFAEAEARSGLMAATGLEWDPGLIPDIPLSPKIVTVEAWLEADIPYQQALIALSLAECNANSPAGAVSDIERRTTNIALQAANLSAEQTRRNAELTYRQTVRSLDYSRIALDIQRERIALQEQLLTVANIRFDRGLITLAQRAQQRIQVIAARKQYLEQLRGYLKAVVAYQLQISHNVQQPR